MPVTSQVNHNQELALKNAFVHLLRNALDHGIETAATRTEQGKSPSGTITIKAFEAGGRIQIEFEDDGKGLAIGDMRAKAQNLGILGPQASSHEAAEMVFAAGFSTAQKVSLVSGRGIGMYAVRQFIAAENGSVELILGPAIDINKNFYRFKIKITLPSFLSSDKKSQARRVTAV